MTIFGQNDYAVRMDWGPTGALACASDLSIVVDVFSFSTAVTIATERGMSVYPYPWRDPSAQEYADRHDAVLGVGRLEAARLGAAAPPSLSPTGLLTGPVVPRLVLPSPNGSTICSTVRESGSQVAIGCLRNASAAADYAIETLRQGGTVALIAAGERWAADNSLRPALEDLLGVGAIAHRLRKAGLEGELSPESRAAALSFPTAAHDLDAAMLTCVGGRELRERGYTDDVMAAAALDASPVVPILSGNSFIPR